MRNLRKSLSLILPIVLADQLIKKVIVHNFVLYETLEIIHNFFDLTYVQNTGAAFSILEDNSIFLVIVSLAVIIYLGTYLYKNNQIKKLELVSYSLIIGGALGNLIDRLFLGYVIDYLAFYPFNYAFPVFNLADICVVIGSFLLIISLGGKQNEIQN